MSATFDELIQEFIMKQSMPIDNLDPIVYRLLRHLRDSGIPGCRQLWYQPDLARNFFRRNCLPHTTPDAGKLLLNNNALAELWDANLALLSDEYPREVLASIAYNGTVLEHAKATLTTLLEEAVYEPEMVAVIFMHFFWQVKRKLAHLPVSDHTAPILMSSKGGTGKSVFVQNLLAPLKELSGTALLHQLADERQFGSLCGYYALFMDEMGSSREIRTQFPAIRTFITSPTVEGRSAYARSRSKFVNNSTLIGTCNADDLSDVTPDGSEARRFAPVMVREPLGFILPHLPEVWDATELWRMIDEKQISPLRYFSDMRDALRTTQRTQTLRHSTNAVEQWTDSFSITKGIRYFIPTVILYEAFQRGSNIKLSPIDFGRKFARAVGSGSCYKRRFGSTRGDDRCYGYLLDMPYSLNIGILQASGYMEPNQELILVEAADVL